MQSKSQDTFELIKTCDNIINIPDKQLHKVINGSEKAYHVLDMFSINHITYKNVKKIIAGRRIDNYIDFCLLDKYLLPVTYNKATKKCVVNIGFFHTDDITSSKPSDRQLYSSVTYALIFYQMYNQKIKLSLDVAHAIINYYTSLFISVFGKQYGLIGIYTNKIPRMKFVIACYILNRFFGVTGNKMYVEAQSTSGANFQEMKDILDTIDFSTIAGFVKSLDKLDIFSGFNLYKFMGRIYNSFGVSFIAAFEDVNRFISTILICNIGGNDIVPAFIYKYNLRVFDALLTLNNVVFRGL